MKNFDLKLMGVQEMNALEMKETDGGFIWFLIAAAVVLLSSCTVNINTQIGDHNSSGQGATTSVDSTLNGNTLEIPMDVPIGY